MSKHMIKNFWTLLLIFHKRIICPKGECLKLILQKTCLSQQKLLIKMKQMTTILEIKPSFFVRHHNVWKNRCPLGKHSEHKSWDSRVNEKSGFSYSVDNFLDLEVLDMDEEIKPQMSQDSLLLPGEVEQNVSTSIPSCIPSAAQPPIWEAKPKPTVKRMDKQTEEPAPGNAGQLKPRRQRRRLEATET
ncbi:intraflagellar transport-associated protein isoform X3 [Saimiri boliviensis]|uniref:intraflagellar transport-associated protein isoform X3 n=1 Tax=Saimiri boliviensis TaxID=27679 RepID=UPI003D77F884